MNLVPKVGQQVGKFYLEGLIELTMEEDTAYRMEVRKTYPLSPTVCSKVRMYH